MALKIAQFVVGAALLSLALNACTSTGPPPAGFKIIVYGVLIDADPGSFELHVEGTRFTPGGTVSVRYANIPNRPGVTPGKGPFPIVQPDGSVAYVEPMHCTSNDISDWSGLVFVSMDDIATGNFATYNVQAIYWVCPVYFPRRGS